MRRRAGIALIAIGFFLIVLGGTVRYWAFERLVVMPINLYSTTTLSGEANYFDPATLKERTEPVVARQIIRADVKASTDRIVVLDSTTVIDTRKGELVQASVERAALDRRSGETVSCCGEQFNNAPATHQGYLYKFPFYTEKRSYPVWDEATLRSYPAQYEGQEKLAGKTVYKFVQKTPATHIRTEPGTGFLVGENSKFAAPVWTEGERTYLVEPVTGTPLAVVTHTRTTLRNSQNKDKAVIIDITLRLDHMPKVSAAPVSLVHTGLPVGALVLGIVAALAGASLLRRNEQNGRHHPAESGDTRAYSTADREPEAGHRSVTPAGTTESDDLPAPYPPR
jgi:hypothetical protein